MKIWVANNLDVNRSAAFATHDAAKEAMRDYPGLWVLRQVEVPPNRDGFCLFYNREIQPEMVLEETAYESKNGRLREQK